MPTKPEFRVRVFLSVDLVGSTAYKALQDDNSWINTFRKFYAEFLSKFRKNYVAYCEKHAECGDYARNFPTLWKTIGDEAIFVNRVDSLFQLFAYVHSFDQTLEEYQINLQSNTATENLDVKGNGWIAAFPFPNQTIPKPSFDSEDANVALPDEKDELAADERPADYDFLGSGIDAGFRISRNSTSSFMTISPVLACLLATANTTRRMKKFNFEFGFLGTNELKGVLKSAQYPIVGLRTERDTNKKKLESLSGELTGANKLEANTLIEFLETFIDHHKVDMPQYTDETGGYKFSKPNSYDTKFVPFWDKTEKAVRSADENRAQGESADASPKDSQAVKLDGLAALEAALRELSQIGKMPKKP